MVLIAHQPVFLSVWSLWKTKNHRLLWFPNVSRYRSYEIGDFLQWNWWPHLCYSLPTTSQVLIWSYGNGVHAGARWVQRKGILSYWWVRKPRVWLQAHLPISQYPRCSLYSPSSCSCYCLFYTSVLVFVWGSYQEGIVLTFGGKYNMATKTKIVRVMISIC